MLAKIRLILQLLSISNNEILYNNYLLIINY